MIKQEGGKGYLTEDYYETFFDNTTEGEATRQYVYGEHLANNIDLHPDQFMFNFLGYSDKFIF
ncbi:hypothetical protein [Winogradskyella sp.]|uniref:hypothetical protein n=1 Tax=Winogradskyella sp. TaxID=1883156 RepID=UPI003AB68725